MPPCDVPIPGLQEFAPEKANDPVTAAPQSGMTKTWEDIEIVFLSDERVQISDGATSETYNYAELGFEDTRTGKPTLPWATSRVLAATQGIIKDSTKTSGEWPDLEKRIQIIRKLLRKHFQIAADPIPFVSGTGYKSVFKIRCGPSFHT
jgi:hypothetical protein